MNRWIVSQVVLRNAEDIYESVTLRHDQDWSVTCNVLSPVGTHRVGSVVVISVYEVGDE